MRHYQLEKKGNTIQAQIAPQFYFAPQATSIGTIKFPQAYYLNAAISFAGFDATATIDIANSRGFSIEAAMDPIVIANKELFAITAFKGEGGPQISVSTLSQPDNPVVQFRQPHVYINGALSMFGLKQGIYANVTVGGIDFELVGELLPGVHFDVDARFGKSGLGASGKLSIGIGTIDLGTLGKAKINTKIDVALDIDIDNDTKPVSKPAVAATLKEASLSTGGSFGQGKTLLDNGLITLVFQADGNLVLYDGGHTSKWDTNTDGRVNPGDFVDGDDGSAHVSDESLSLGKSFVSGATLLDNGLTKLIFQGDGNLCLYKKGGGEYLWGTNTAGKGAKRVDLQADGNLVIYDGANKALWTSGTAGKGIASLVLQTDGNLVMYDGTHSSAWASNTAG